MSSPTAEPAKETFEKPQPAHIGANANRSCTNPCALIFFIAVWVGFIAFAGVAFKNGDIYKLINGVDYLGNVCGRGTPKNVTASVAAEWEQYQFLYYPIGFNKATGAFQVSGAKDLGVCVKKCPSAKDDVYTYSQNRAKNLPESYFSWFNTEDKFHRCIPSFDCGAVYGTTTSAPVSSTTTTTTTTTTVGTTTTESGSVDPKANCEKNKGDASGVFNQLAGYGDVARQGFNEVRARWWVIVVCALITLILSFLWMVILNRAVKPMVVITILLVVVTLGVIAGVCLNQYSKIKATPAPDTDQMHTYLAIGIGAAVLEFLLICILLYIRTDIMVACDIIEEAAQIPIAIKSMIAVPPVLVLFMVAFTIFFLFVGANIYTAADTISLRTPVLTTNTNSSASASPTTTLAGVTTTPAPFSLENSTLAIETQQFSNWRPWGFAFTIFMFLWTYGFFNAIGFMIISFCAIFWYWSKPGSPKEPQDGVAKAVWLTFRYHTGTLALGSLVVAVIQMIRICVAWLEHHLREVGGRSEGVRCIICCAQCCLACFESIIKFINRNAYIVQTMTGEPFMTAARHALSLLTSNAIAVVGVTVISEYVMFFSKIILTGISLGIGYGILSGMADFSSAGVIFMLIFIGIVCYFVATVFLGIFGVCIDAVMISYCYDLEQNNGQGRPYFMPEDLSKHIEKAKTRMSEKAREAQNKQFEAKGTDYQKVEA